MNETIEDDKIGMKEVSAKKLSKAIHSFCLECSGHSYKRVKECDVVDCRLYPYRMLKG